MYYNNKILAWTLKLILVSSYSINLFAESLPTDPRNLSGVWMNDDTLDERLKRQGLKRLDPNAPERRPSAGMGENLLTNEYKIIYRQQQTNRSKLAVGTQRCQWPGMPRILTYPYPLEILHTPERITFIYEAESQVRRIFLDRRHHLPEDDLDPSYNGDSYGYWQGNTLIINTIGFNTQTSLWGNLPHSEKMHILEKIHYVDEDTIHNEVTITDPLALKKPLQRTIVYSKRPDWRIREYSCMENNRDAPDAEGQRVQGVVN